MAAILRTTIRALRTTIRARPSRPPSSPETFSMSDLQRRPLPRKAKAGVTYEQYSYWVPQQPTDNPDYILANKLNMQAYVHTISDDVDDKLRAAAAGTKYKRHRWNAVTPTPSSNKGPIDMNDEDTLSQLTRAGEICDKITHPKPDQDIESTVKAVVAELQSELPMFQSENRQWAACLLQ